METPRRAVRNLHLANVSNISTPVHIPASPFMKSLGYGTGINVFRLDRSPKRGEMRSPWAIKRISQRARTNGQLVFNERLQDEAKLLRQLCHPNIVGFRGVTKAEDGIDSLALECCSTSLGTILEDRLEDDLGPLPAKDSLKMIHDIAKALDYLHVEAKILHADLKSFNILIKGDFEICKLCDFGVSLPLDENDIVDFNKRSELRYVGTDAWSAPEVLDEQDAIDAKADIFSFGLVIYETIALVPPHTLNMTIDEKEDEDLEVSTIEDDASKKEISLLSNESLLNRFDGVNGTRPPLPQAFKLTDEYNRVVEIFYCCTNELAEDRPTAKAIWQSLQQSTIDEQ